MASITLLNTPNSIVYELPPGKPSPKECFTGSPDNRTRIPQPAQKGPACVYYAFNYLRRRIGPIHDKKFARERNIEKIISNWRKSITIDHSATSGKDLLARFSINPYHMCIGSSRNTERWNRGSFSERTAIMHDIRLMIASLTPEHQGCLMQGFAIRTMAMQYNLLPSTWDPKQPITSLIGALKTFGPMAVGGDLGGTHCYKSKALLSNRKIAGHSIYYFPKGAERNSVVAYHVVVVIGAEKTKDQEIVYFLDPNNASLAEADQPIYAQSYRSFTSYIAPYHRTAKYSPSETVDDISGILTEILPTYGFHAPLERKLGIGDTPPKIEYSPASITPATVATSINHHELPSADDCPSTNNSPVRSTMSPISFKEAFEAYRPPHEPSYTYLSFDKNTGWKFIELTWFQALLRRIFGCYASTHLSVIRNAFRLIEDDADFQLNLDRIQKTPAVFKIYLSTVCSIEAEKIYNTLSRGDLSAKMYRLKCLGNLLGGPSYPPHPLLKSPSIARNMVNIQQVLVNAHSSI